MMRSTPRSRKTVTQDHPRVTVGIPVFNGESFLAQTIAALLHQTFTDFEIVISDNASTDRTETICRAFAASDRRIRYHRSETNWGAAWNHNRVFELANGELFKWNSADDLCAPEFLSLCVAALDQDPSAVMATAHCVEIDESGSPLASVSVPGQTLLTDVPVGALPHVRFRQTIRLDHLCLSIYSLIRSSALRQTALMGNYADSDRVLLANLALLGHAVTVPKILFFNRDHPGRFTRLYNGERYRDRGNWFDPSNANRKLFPYWRELFELLRVVWKSPIGWRERLRCCREIGSWLRRERYLRLLYIDATCHPRKWIVRRFPRAKVAWNRLKGREIASRAY
jgi:glycosyltransferase involved in cell wall biosynthesis